MYPEMDIHRTGLIYARRVTKFCIRFVSTNSQAIRCRGIEWSLRAFASMRAVRFFLRARAVINFLMRAASTLDITNGER